MIRNILIILLDKQKDGQKFQDQVIAHVSRCEAQLAVNQRFNEEPLVINLIYLLYK